MPGLSGVTLRAETGLSSERLVGSAYTVEGLVIEDAKLVTNAWAMLRVTKASGHSELSGNVLTGGACADTRLVYSARSGAHYKRANVWDNTVDHLWDNGSAVTHEDLTELDPTYVDVSASDPLDWDLHPDTGSPLIDAGNPAQTDPDGSAADIGAYGGAYGAW